MSVLRTRPVRLPWTFLVPMSALLAGTAVVTPSTGWAVLAAAPVAVSLVIALVWLARAGDAGHRLHADNSEDAGLAQRDDDWRWYLGATVYANRTDPALLVHQRVGSRWTLNLGHPASWLLLTALVVLAAVVNL